ncbi:unnamed protein product [Urochloa humidicola]
MGSKGLHERRNGGKSNGGFEVVPAVRNHRRCLSFPITSRCNALHAEELFQWVCTSFLQPSSHISTNQVVLTLPSSSPGPLMRIICRAGGHGECCRHERGVGDKITTCG